MGEVEVAGGRDLTRQSPSWLNALIWSSGLGAAAWFVWRLLVGDGEPTCGPPSLGHVLSRCLAVAVLPALLLLSGLEKAVRRLAE
jgi:hypothetical protein